MNSKTRSCVALLSCVLGLILNSREVIADSDAAETGRLLAVLLDAGRTVIAENQSLLNDPRKTNKGFTPEVFERQFVAQFKERMHIDLGNLQNERVPEKAKKLLAL